MGRYNTVLGTGTTTGATTISTPLQGQYTTLGGVAPYTVTVPNPANFNGTVQSFYNSTSGTVTLATPTGVFNGPGAGGATTFLVPAGTTVTIATDGTNYIIVNEDGGPLVTTSGTFSGTATFNGAVNIAPANASVTISPTGTGSVTINPATAGTIDNVTIGANTAADAKINTLTLNTALTGNGVINGGTF
jgi:hypothetical protein